MPPSAAAVAEARRKAILSRGNERLNKLTHSVRGPDAPGIIQDRPSGESLRPDLKSFVGEETNIPYSRSPSPEPTRRATSMPPPDPSVWSEEQQHQFMNALMSGIPPVPSSSAASPSPPLIGQHIATKAPTSQRVQSRLHRLMPLIHLVSVWGLLAYYVLWEEPEAYEDHAVIMVENPRKWTRWAALKWEDPYAEYGSRGVQLVPFFWAFMTLQVALHSLRIFSKFDEVEPGMLLSFILPHLPPPFPSLVMNLLKYMQMGGLFLDDVAAVIFGIGVIVACSS